VHEATLRAARNMSTILCYESPSVTQEFVPTFFIDIGAYIDVKVESIKEHWDQRNKPYVQPERVRGQAVFRGSQARAQYAEGFEAVRIKFQELA
jgi:LmbE family N-acetylglucosaminyl deacetylase